MQTLARRQPPLGALRRTSRPAAPACTLWYCLTIALWLPAAARAERATTEPPPQDRGRVILELPPSEPQALADSVHIEVPAGQTVWVRVGAHQLEVHAQAPATPPNAAHVAPPPPAGPAASGDGAAPPPTAAPWVPLPVPERWSHNPSGHPDLHTRRRAMLYYGPPYRSVAAAKRAYHHGLLDKPTYRDTIWTLKIWRKHMLLAAKRAYRAHAIDRAQYRQQVASIEHQFRGF